LGGRSDHRRCSGPAAYANTDADTRTDAGTDAYTDYATYARTDATSRCAHPGSDFATSDSGRSALGQVSRLNETRLADLANRRH
jgi:hypothetical protein